MELEFFEKLLIASLRKFGKFLSMESYVITELSYGDRDGDIIKYRSYPRNREIDIVFNRVAEGISLDIIFYKKGMLVSNKNFNLNDMDKLYPEIKKVKKIIDENNFIEIIDSYYEMIIKYFLPVVKGSKWI